MIQNILESLTQKHLYLNPLWLNNMYQTSSNLECILQNALINDITISFDTVKYNTMYPFPNDLIKLEKFYLCNCYRIVQILWAKDIGKSGYSQVLKDDYFDAHNEDKTFKRKDVQMLYFKMTDGLQIFGGFEYKPLNINHPILPGAKAIIYNNLMLRFGNFLLDSANFLYLGGKVESLGLLDLSQKDNFNKHLLNLELFEKNDCTSNDVITVNPKTKGKNDMGDIDYQSSLPSLSINSPNDMAIVIQNENDSPIFIQKFSQSAAHKNNTIIAPISQEKLNDEIGNSQLNNAIDDFYDENYDNNLENFTPSPILNDEPNICEDEDNENNNDNLINNENHMYDSTIHYGEINDNNNNKKNETDIISDDVIESESGFVKPGTDTSISNSPMFTDKSKTTVNNISTKIYIDFLKYVPSWFSLSDDEKPLKIKGFIQTILSKLLQDPVIGWFLKVKVIDGTGSIDVWISDEVLTDLAGITCSEFKELSQQADQDPSQKLKKSQITLDFQRKLINLNGIFYISKNSYYIRQHPEYGPNEIQRYEGLHVLYKIEPISMQYINLFSGLIEKLKSMLNLQILKIYK